MARSTAVFFFFQAEDGIRDGRVTGVPDVCSSDLVSAGVFQGRQTSTFDGPNSATTGIPNAAAMWAGPESLPRNSEAPAIRFFISASGAPASVRRSEERRVGKECRSRWSTYG